MNLVDCHVTKKLGPVYSEYGKWWVSVQYDSYGRISETKVMFDTREEADDVKVGHVFQA